jgi:hypothetical protein
VNPIFWSNTGPTAKENCVSVRELVSSFVRYLSMNSRLTFALALSFSLISGSLHAGPTVTEESIRATLVAHAVPLHGAGEARLLAEARSHEFFLLGELHGEREIPELIKDLWPQLWAAGYRHVGGELSPWAVEHLDQARGLWTQDQAAVVSRFAGPKQDVLWGCDIDEGQPERLIADMAKLNPEDATLQQMMAITAHGYYRKQAPQLLSLSEAEHPAIDVTIGGISLWSNIRQTLRVEALRSNPDTKLGASETREVVMKDLFLSHYRQGPEGKVFLRFGVNHLHRGYDARGVSTLGNFVAEWALAENRSVFNVGVFAAGGKEHLAGETFDADERQDELSFALLAQLAGPNATLFDLRVLRPMLHSIAPEKRTPVEINLTYWADSYDFLICYPIVSPLMNDVPNVPGK